MLSFGGNSMTDRSLILFKELLLNKRDTPMFPLEGSGLSNNQITDVGIISLSEVLHLTKLKVLILPGNQISNEVQQNYPKFLTQPS